MGIPAGTARFVLHGVTGDEIFEVGVWMTAPITDQTDAQNLANSCWNSWLLAAAPDWTQLIGTDTSYTGGRLYAYPNGGPTAQYVAEAVATPEAGVGAQNLPLQTCMVLTTLTGAAGRRHRGRLYLPAHAATTEAGHQFPNTLTTNCPTAAAAWFDDINNTTAEVVVMSSAGTSTRPVTQVRANSTPDIQRRRANKLAPAHTHTATL